MRFGKIESGDKVRLYFGGLAAVTVRIYVEPGDILNKPSRVVTEKMVVERRRELIVLYKFLGQSGKPLFDEMTVGRIVAPRYHFVCEVGFTEVGKDSEKDLRSDKSDVDTVVCGMDEFKKLRKRRLLLALLEQSVVYRCRLRGLAAALCRHCAEIDKIPSAVLSEPFVNAAAHIALLASAYLREHIGRFFHAVHERKRVGEFERSFYRRDGAPVAQAVMRKPFFIELLCEVVGVADECCGVVLDYFFVAAHYVCLIREVKEDCVPNRSVAPVVAPAAGGNYSGKLTVFTLCGSYIFEPLRVAFLGREIVRGLLGGYGRVARPAVFLPVRTVGGEVVKIRKR